MKYYVALDVGNVLCKVDFKKFTLAISEIINESSWEVGHRINRFQKLHDVGHVSMTDILESEFNIKSPVILNKLLNVWNNDVLNFDVRVFDFFVQLNINLKDNLHVALLSNVGTEHSLVMDSYVKSCWFNDSKLFSNSIRYYSCNVGVRKPQSLYYQSFILNNPDFKGCVYLDDLKENLESSKQFGFIPVEFNLEKIEDIYISLHEVEKLISDK